MHKTAWTNPKSSSFPSDRIRPAQKHTAGGQPSGNSKGKGKASNSNGPQKSTKVRRLEELADALRRYTGEEVDPKGGCFCLAREHALSEYTPICLACGLILCSINLPHFKCPFCYTALLDTPQHGAVLARVEAAIADTLAQEAEARERAEWEARQAAGAFPTLGGSASGTGTGSALSISSADTALRAPPQTHKVLSLNAKTKSVVISSYSPTPSRPPSRSDVKEAVETRVGRPPAEVPYSREQVPRDRPWANLLGESITYRRPVKTK